MNPVSVFFLTHCLNLTHLTHFTNVWQAATYLLSVFNASYKFCPSHLFFLLSYSINWISSGNTAIPPTESLGKASPTLIQPLWSQHSQPPRPWGLYHPWSFKDPVEDTHASVLLHLSPSPLWPPPSSTFLGNFTHHIFSSKAEWTPVMCCSFRNWPFQLFSTHHHQFLPSRWLFPCCSHRCLNLPCHENQPQPQTL